FVDSYFDLLTVAQAFHWFDYKQSITEFKRVIKSDGVIVIFRKCAKNGGKILPEFVWKVLSNYFDFQEDLKSQDSFSFMSKAGFKSCELIEFDYEDIYTPDDFFGFLRTHSTYNLVPDVRKEEYLKEIKNKIQDYLEKGLYVYSGKIEIWCLQK
ncbi:MAG: methyltransferase domain-containing protein, partial [Candidatus Magasanikbacteria bacterium]|nr:methyltransferase domain-containing protein [Candidatus Magasanikbacteria bacterium]